jgi:hypothetical protein
VTARKARRARSRQLANRFILAFLVVLALAGLYGVAGLSRAVLITTGVKPVHTVGRLQVSSALVGCPSPGLGVPTGGNIAVASAPASAGSGQLALTPLHLVTNTSPVTTVSSAPRPGQLDGQDHPSGSRCEKAKVEHASHGWRRGADQPANGGLLVAARDRMRRDLRCRAASTRGEPTARRQPPGSDFWFVGPETTKLQTELYLINADDKGSLADAHVGVQTRTSGPALEVPPDSGINVPPHSMVVAEPRQAGALGEGGSPARDDQRGPRGCSGQETGKRQSRGSGFRPRPSPP